MTREIKFRAWDRRAERMLETPFSMLGEVTCFNLLEQWVMERSFGLPSLMRMNDLQLMQYTGLKDKNGKEIYEGDIVKLSCDSFSKKFGVCKRDYLTKVEFDKKLSAFVFKRESLVWFFQDTDFNGSKFTHEIIGNIYKNPELLK